MAETYTSKYANGAAVDAALDKAESALQPGDLGSAASCDIGTGSGDVAAGDHTHADATPAGEGGAGAAGFLSAADKATLDGLGTAAFADTGDFATSAQGSKADTAVQPTDVLPVFIKVKNVTDGSLAVVMTPWTA